MAAPLPRTVRLKLRQTLALWRHWQCDPPLPHAPQVVAPLTAGISNFSVLVEAGRRYAVRIDGADPAACGLDRQGERRTLQAAHVAGLAPAPRYCNPALGALVCDYLPPDPQQSAAPAEVGRLLRAIHRLPPTRQRLDAGERILRYESALGQSGDPLAAALREYRSAVLACLEAGDDWRGRTVLCHNDLLSANRLRSRGRLWALDWEYSAMGNPLYDLAVVAAGDELGEAQSVELLAAYLERQPGAAERRALLRQGCVYRYLELLWYLARPRPALPRDLPEAKLAALAQALAAARS
jgi:thiamine kinase